MHILDLRSSSTRSKSIQKKHKQNVNDYLFSQLLKTVLLVNIVVVYIVRVDDGINDLELGRGARQVGCLGLDKKLSGRECRIAHQIVVVELVCAIEILVDALYRYIREELAVEQKCQEHKRKQMHTA